MNRTKPTCTAEPVGPHPAFSNKSLFKPPPLRTPPPSSRTRRSRRRLSRGAAATNSQKRARHTYDQDSTMTTPLSEWSEIPSIPSSAYLSSVPSPSPLVNTRYQLAGGLDTPTAAIETRLDEQEWMDLNNTDDLRPNRLMPSSARWKNNGQPRTPVATVEDAAERRKRKQPADNGWGVSLMSAVGGIAWKGINFCWSTVFGGFQAGGGTSYQISGKKPQIVRQESWTDVEEKEDVFSDKYEAEDYSLSTPIPGQFPEDIEEEGEEAAVAAEGNSTWRLQKVRNAKEIGSPTSKPKYKLVPPSEILSADNQSQGRRGSASSAQSRSPSQASVASMRPRAKAHHRATNSHAGSPSLQMISRQASVASARRLHRTSEPDFSRFRAESPTGNRPPMSNIAPTYTNASPGLSHSRRQSAAVSPDVLKFERKIRSKERKEDENIRRLNKQLKDMIREGRQALATTVDIEDESETEPEDEGYVEGEEGDRDPCHRRHKW